MDARILTLRQVFDEVRASKLYRDLFFKGQASDWTLDTEVLIDESADDGSEFWQPPKIPKGYDCSVFSSDIEYLVDFADQICRQASDDGSLQALRYYFYNKKLPPEDWRPNQS